MKPRPAIFTPVRTWISTHASGRTVREHIEVDGGIVFCFQRPAAAALELSGEIEAAMHRDARRRTRKGARTA